ncbi:MAG: cation:proton antiporter [Spirochaetaceae bacterium]
MNHGVESTAGIPVLVIVGLILFLGVFAGRLMKSIRLPSLMGFMALGLITGPAVLGIINSDTLENLSFVTEIALGFVALTIGFEFNLKQMKGQAGQLVRIVAWESVLAFTFVTLLVYLVTFQLPLAVLFGAIAVTTAPAGTVAVVQETRARGRFTSTLLAVVGFDDVSAILIFGFALALTKFLLGVEAGLGEGVDVIPLIAAPFTEIGLSVAIGITTGLAAGLLSRTLGQSRDVFILTLATVFLLSGLSQVVPMSLVLTAMTAGAMITNTQSRTVVEPIAGYISEVTPAVFVLFFALAGAHLDLSLLPSVGAAGMVYVIGRAGGKIFGASIGARRGKAPENVQKYLGLSILSQAGLAIGLALIALQELSPLGPEGEAVARTVIVTITATSVIFELVGPILTRYSLDKTGESGISAR